MMSMIQYCNLASRFAHELAVKKAAANAA